jgi:hypothetical protein
VTIEQSEMPPPSLGLRAVIVRFLVKMAFFSGMLTLSGLLAYWVPDPPPSDLDTHTALLMMVVGYCIFITLIAGTIGLAVTVFTAGRKPSWD